MAVETKRLNVAITPEQLVRLQQTIPDGIRSQVVRGLIDGFLTNLERQGFDLLKDVMQGRFTITGKHYG